VIVILASVIGMSVFIFKNLVLNIDMLDTIINKDPRDWTKEERFYSIVHNREYVQYWIDHYQRLKDEKKKRRKKPALNRLFK
jgi:hypothetical protein